MIDEKKEFINMVRNRSNHIFVIIVTIGVAVTKLLVDEKINIWFY